ncbi:MAG: hypothetical protein ABI190_05890 [Casimicrobiaceae bacterium]
MTRGARHQRASQPPLTAPITGDRVWNDAYAQHTALRCWAAPEEMAGPITYLASGASS